MSLLTDLLPQDLPSARIVTFGPVTGLQRMKPTTSRMVSYGLALMSIPALLFGYLNRCWRKASVATAGAATLGASSISLHKYIVGLRKTPITEMQDQADALLEDLVSRSTQVG